MPSVGHSQFLWDVAHSDFDGRYYYCFDAVSCFENNCVVAGSLVDNNAERVYSMFWASNDNGNTWNMQDPNLPPDSNFKDEKFFAAVQQINKNSIVALRNNRTGDSSETFILRSNDAGKNWNKQLLDLSDAGGLLRDVSFYDSLSGIVLAQKNILYNGILVIGGGGYKIFTTLDGGNHWDSSTFTLDGGSFNCYSNGSGKYKIFKSPHGPIYSTIDNWKTVDSSAPLILDQDDPNNDFNYEHCNFTGGDTIICYGYNVYDKTTRNYDRYRALLIRSTDAGLTWEKPEIFQGSLWILKSMSSLARDTIIAGGLSGDMSGSQVNSILVSLDKGRTWREDSLLIDTAYSAFSTKGIVLPSDGVPLSIYGHLDNNIQSFPTLLLRGHTAKSKVENQSSLSFTDRIFPNPATNILNIASVESTRPYWIIDVLGRTVLSGMTLDHTTLTIDISSISPGMYIVLSESIRGKVKIGKLMVAGK